MTNAEVRPSLVTPHLRTKLSLTADRVEGTIPNTFLGLIPAGRKTITQPLRGISRICRSQSSACLGSLRACLPHAGLQHLADGWNRCPRCARSAAWTRTVGLSDPSRDGDIRCLRLQAHSACLVPRPRRTSGLRSNCERCSGPITESLGSIAETKIIITAVTGHPTR